MTHLPDWTGRGAPAVDALRSGLRRLLLLSILGAAACGPTSTGDGTGAGRSNAERGAPAPYLGQEPPGEEPVLFAPGVVSTGLHTRDLTMTPEGDEIYFSVQAGPFAAILGTRLAEGRWTEPEVVSFSRDPSTMELEPHVAPDGRRFFFVSNRPADGSPMPAEERGQLAQADIWVMDRDGDGWGKPRNLGAPVNTEASEFFPSVTRDGTLYFTREDPATGRNFIYRARSSPNGYGEPERLPEAVNSANQFNAFVDPDESYLILGVFGRGDSTGGTDYYVVFRDPDDTWHGPLNLGPAVNQPRGAEWSPFVSPDGRYFFFMSTRQPYPNAAPQRLSFDWLKEFAAGPESGNPAIYWMEAGFLEDLRREVAAARE